MDRFLPKIVCLMGPTASGKTALAVKLVQRFPCEIISVDSAMIYRGMNIGSAKPCSDILKIAPHRLIDIRDPNEAYSVAQFRLDALDEIKDIIRKGKIPLLVGGTMMYFRALQNGIADMPSADQALRATLTQEGKELGWPVLHQRLVGVDPRTASRIHPHDSQRIQRALEVYLLAGKSVTDFQHEQTRGELDFEIINLIVAPDNRAVLHERIAKRFSDMLAEGLVDEVAELVARYDLNLDKPAIRCVGYRQVFRYLNGTLTYAQMQEQGIFATRQLAKRQLTWLRRWTDAIWFDSESDELMDSIDNFLS